MAKVALRIYNREIESLIDQGSTNEAIAHCHQILKTFSKHLATYRLLGKAYLESKRYNDAVDIFGRILMSVPDDFVSHVGMSIISDEENKLDDAIWHMQRAFESQPSNSAIQGELQRLYGRRDGVEPPKIRMTRGALAQMYVQGELYPQAIAEIHAVLSQEPDRADMQVLLARSYFRSGQKADASEICAQLIKRYLYCLDANRIMVDLLSANPGASESAQMYRQRVAELDPYTTLVKGSVFQSNEVADSAINLERLVYEEESQTGQGWSAPPGVGLGVAIASIITSTSSSSDQPDWLKAGGISDSDLGSSVSSQAVLEPDSIGTSQSSENIPDFLRDAGWGESINPEQPTSFFDSESVGDDLTPADIPDWLKGQAPSNVAQTESIQSGSTQSIETPDWLSSLGGNQAVDSTGSIQPAPAQPTDIPDWLSGLGDTQTPETELVQSGNGPDSLTGFENSPALEPELAQPNDIPGWLSGLDNTQTSQEPKHEQPSDVPDWLAGLGDSQFSGPAQSQEGNIPDWSAVLGDSESSEPAQAQAGNIPDWSVGLGDSQTSELTQVQAGNLPDWLAGLGDSDTSESTQPGNVSDWPTARLGDTESSEPAQPGNVPAWLAALDSAQQEPAQPSATIENLGTSAQEQDDAVAWLESLAAKHGAKPEEMVTNPNNRSETPPEWVSQAQNIDRQEPIPQGSAPSLENLGSTTQEQDDAVAWMESLAAKHGAKPEEMVTDPNQRSDNPPEWVAQAQSMEEAQPFSPITNEEEPSQPSVNALNIGEQFFAEFENASTPMSASPSSSGNDETGTWLRDLKEKEKQNEFSAQPASSSKGIPDWLIGSQFQSDSFEEQNPPRRGIPDWLKESPSTRNIDDQIEFVEQESDLQKSDLPSWLSGDEENPIPQDTFTNQDVSQSDLSNWLSGLDDEPGLPFTEMPSPDSILISSMPAKPDKPSVAQEPVLSKSDLPDWLRDSDSRGEQSEAGLNKPISQEHAIPTSIPAESNASVNPIENLPDWLQSPGEEESEIINDDTAPWLHREAYEANELLQPKPTSPSDWHPVEPITMSTPLEKKEKSAIETGNPIDQTPVEHSIETRLPAKKKSGLPVKQPPQPEPQIVTNALIQAKSELDRGDIPAALEHYKKLIKKGRHLEETIRDLSDSLYRYPVEVGIWQTLGDAYMRANRLKEALEAYNKAEELIR
jgi:tetratricopeptide (TPR) repeat protein